MKRRVLILAVSVSIFIQPCLAEDSAIEVVGEISNVIVYRGQALVTRSIEVDLAKGSSELIVQKLPDRIVPESLYAQTLGDVTISSVRYRERAVKEDTREEVKQLDAEIEKLMDHRRHIKAKQELISQHLGVLAKLENFTVAAQNTDLKRGILQFEPLEKLVGYIEAKRGEYHTEFVKLDDEVRQVDKELELLQRKRNELQAGRSRTEREAVLVVNSPKSKEIVIQLNYLVNDASWLPQYNLRAQPDKSNVIVEYNSIIHQASGEDWNNVAMSLSTAKPTMVAGAPALDPMEVIVASGAPRKRLLKVARDEMEVGASYAPRAGGYRDLTSEFKKIQTARQEMAQKGRAANLELNRAALSNQMMELQADKEAVKVIKKEARMFARTEGVSVTYNLGEGLSMPSRSDQQLITIANFQTKSDFLMIATPLLTDYVYLQGDVTNDSEVILLAGSASMYRDGEFVGKGHLDMVTIGEKFTAGFGVDSHVRISREFKDKKVDTLWGDRVEKYEYRIAVDNYKTTNVKLRLLERIPYTKDEKLEIKEFTTNTAMSKDVEYLRVEKDKGILRWDIDLKPATVEEKATVITYGYTMKYDNDMHIQPISGRR